MNFRKIRPQQTVARHGHEDAGLAELENQQDGSNSSKRASTDKSLRQPMTGERGRDRSRIPKVRCIYPHPGDHCRHQHIEHGADDEACNDSNRHVPLRISCFFGRSRHGIESDKGKEDDRGATHNAPKAARQKRMPIVWLNHEGAECNHENDDCDLDDDDGRIGPRALTNSVNQERGHRCDDEKRREIHGNRLPGNDWQRRRRIICECVAPGRDYTARSPVIIYQPERKFQAKEAAAQSYEIARPTDCNRHVPDRVFKNKIPTDDPRDDLTECRIGIGVSRA